jgi:hypothetical protein
MSHQQNTRIFKLWVINKILVITIIVCELPKVKLEVARKGFYFQGAMAFNKLSLHVRQINSIVHFKSAINYANEQFLDIKYHCVFRIVCIAY